MPAIELLLEKKKKKRWNKNKITSEFFSFATEIILVVY